MTDTLADRIREIKEREAKATKGPFLIDAEEDGTQVIYIPLPNVTPDAISILVQADWATEEDMEFFAHSRADIPWLVEQLEKALREIKDLKEETRSFEVERSRNADRFSREGY